MRSNYINWNKVWSSGSSKVMKVPFGFDIAWKDFN